MFRRYVGLYALLFLFSGCAVQLPTQDPANLEKFRSGNVAVRVQAPEKNIIYNESLYRVLWIEYKDRTVSYDGAWEIEQDLDDEFVKGLASLGIRAKVLSRSESLKSYEKEVAAEYIKAPRQGLEPLVQKMSGPQYHFYKSLPNLNTFGAL